MFVDDGIGGLRLVGGGVVVSTAGRTCFASHVVVGFDCDFDRHRGCFQDVFGHQPDG